MQAISLDWLAAQQQTSTLTQERYGFFCAKCSAEFNEISLFKKKQTGNGRKLAKIKEDQKNANRPRSESKIQEADKGSVESPKRGYHCVKSVQIWSFFWFVFSRIRTEYREILRISPYSVRMRENTDQKILCIWTLFKQGTLVLF